MNTVSHCYTTWNATVLSIAYALLSTAKHWEVNLDTHTIINSTWTPIISHINSISSSVVLKSCLWNMCVRVCMFFSCLPRFWALFESGVRRTPQKQETWNRPLTVWSDTCLEKVNNIPSSSLLIGTSYLPMGLEKERRNAIKILP